MKCINYRWDGSEVISINAIYLNSDNEEEAKVMPFFYIDKKKDITKLYGEKTDRRIDKSELLELMKEIK